MDDGFTIRRARADDLKRIQAFLDSYLRRDWFLSPKGLVQMLESLYWWMAECDGELRAVAAMNKQGALMQLLVHPDYRKCGIGRRLLERLRPAIIRSRSDQSTGDPRLFYEKNGYRSVGVTKVGRRRNIELLERRTDSGVRARGKV